MDYVPAPVLREADADPAALDGVRIAVLGFGSQGRAHAQNLRDSGLSVVVGLPIESRSREVALSLGFRVETPGQAAMDADLVAMMVPDEVQARVFQEAVEPSLVKEPGGPGVSTLLFAHGFAIRFGTIVAPPTIDVVMVAPAAPGRALRQAFVDGGGVAGVLAVESNTSGKARTRALAYARAIGLLRAGVVETTFREETECDLFGEQAVVCGGISALVRAGFETLVSAGYRPEIAYFECAHQLRLLADMVSELGISGMRRGISGTARFGDLTRGPRVIGEDSRAAMRSILEDVQSGRFAAEWLAENETGRSRLSSLTKESEEHLIEAVGARVRAIAKPKSGAG